jgi:hypothetical protein
MTEGLGKIPQQLAARSVDLFRQETEIVPKRSLW